MTNKNIIIIITILTVTLLSFTVSQQSQNDETLIVGIWVPEGSPNSTFEFTTDGVAKRTNNGIILKTYNWSISNSSTPSGLTESHLELTNVQDTNDNYTYEIDALNDQILSLVYKNSSSFKRSNYTKQ